MKLVNLTPHKIDLADESGQVIATIPPSGIVARVAASQKVAGSVSLEGKSFQIVQSVFGQLEGLPEPEEGTLYIVSSLVAQVATERDDLVAPDTGPTAIRDNDGRIIAVRRFQKF